MTRVSKLAAGYQTPVESSEQQLRVMQEPTKPNLSEAEERGTNIQGGHEQDRLPSLKDVVTPGWPASKALSHDDLVQLVAKSFRLSSEDAYAWIIDGESSTLSRGITTIQPTMPTGPDQGAKKSRGQIQVSSGMFRNAELSLHEDRHGSTEHHHRKRGPDQSRGFYDLTPGDGQRLVYGNTVADVRMMPNGTVILGSIYREKPGAPGEASELLRKLVSRADQAGTPMRLLAAPMTAGRAGHRMTVEDLVAWYGRFGFVQDPKQSAEEYARRMTRAPRPSKLKKDGGGPGGAEGSMTGADVHTDVGGRTGKRSRTQGTITLRDNSR